MKNRTLIKTLSAILAVVMVLCSAPLSGFTGIELPGLFSVKAEAEEYTEGVFTYSVSSGKATITDCNTSVSGDIVIPDTLGGYPVTSLGDYAFFDCDSLTSVTIPDSVTSIGSSAFAYCDSLTSITVDSDNQYYSSDEYGALYNKDKTTLIQYPIGNSRETFEIPDSVTSIGYYAFYYFTSLTSITVDSDNQYYSSDEYGVLYNKDKTTLIQYPIGNSRETFEIPDSVTSIGDWAFAYCDSLTSVTIPDSVTSIGSDAFYNCTSLTSVTIPDSVTSIGSDAFYNCTSLTSVTIGDSVTSIGNSAFRNCDSLTSVTIGNSVTSIGSWAFEDCDSLTSVTIGDSVKSIGDCAFFDCDSLTSVTIGNSVTNIGICAFRDCTSLASVTIGNSVTSIGVYAFYDCDNLTDVYYNGTEEEWNEITIGSYNEDLLNATIHFAEASTPAEDFKYTIENSEVTITKYIGSDTEVAIPSEIEGYPVTSIGNHAFYYCTNLTSVTIPDSVTSIGSNVFEDCENLETVTIGNGVTSIGSSTFSGCISLISVTIGDSVTSIGSNVFEDCENLETVTIGNGVTSIGSSTFSGCISLISVTIGDSVTSIGLYAFEDCTSLSDVYYTGDIESWCNIPFDNNSTNPMYYAKNFYIDNTLVKEIVIPDTVTEIRNYAFYSFESITSVTIGNGVTSIGYRAFQNCTSLETATIGDSVTSIANYMFYNCTSLETVTIGNSVTSIGSFAFEKCDSLTSIIIPDSVKSISNDAFYSCDSLTSVTIGNSVASIGNSAFYYCTSLTDVYYNGTEEEWNEITIGSYNECLLNATIHFIDEICEHEYVKYVTAPTCTKKGFTTYVCSLCFESYVGDFVDATGHTPEDAVEENRVESTCTEEGSCDIVIYCLTCGEELSREKESIPMKEHIWSKWQVFTKPTDIKEGTEIRMCEVCEELEKRNIPVDATVIYLTDLQGNIISKQYAENDSDIISFENLAYGEYTVTVSKETYATRTYTVFATDGEISLDFSLNKTGDMNGDGKINAIDVARANAHAKGASALSGYDLACVDVNGDGKVNAIDVALINAHSKGVKPLW